MVINWLLQIIWPSSLVALNLCILFFLNLAMSSLINFIRWSWKHWTYSYSSQAKQLNFVLIDRPLLESFLWFDSYSAICLLALSFEFTVYNWCWSELSFEWARLEVYESFWVNVSFFFIKLTELSDAQLLLLSQFVEGTFELNDLSDWYS